MKYRADIDGIRAIAVSIVILFHYGVVGFAGGYVGVDIFFVLSGFLISSIIFAQTGEGRFCFSNFYFRRIRRLFPVYLVVMLATFAVAYAYMLPRDFREFGQSLLASTIYLSNVLFYMEAGYFDTASHLKPLLHTWSLSVEEQFYVVFPVVAWLCGRMSARGLFLIFGALTVISLVAAAAYIETDNSAVFYLYPFRAWEMFFGTLLATGFIPAIRSVLWNNLLAVLGLAMLVGSTFLYDESTLFPGLSAIIPCLGTVLLIHSGSGHQGWIHQILATKPMVFIGNISYSLYLWHWPVFVLYVYNKPEGTGVIDILIMAATTFVLSVLSWKYVETPFRHGRVKFSDNHRSVFAATAVFSVIFMAAGLYLHKSNGMPQRLDERTAAFASAAGDLFGDLGGCVEENNDRLPGIGHCLIGDPLNAESFTVIWGDSHGGAYKRGYTTAIEGKNQSVLLVWMGGCPPVFGIAKDENVSSKAMDDQCPIRNQAFADFIEKEKSRINAIILVGRWSYYLAGEGLGVDSQHKIRVWPENGSPSDVKNQTDFFANAMKNTLQGLHRDGFKVFVVEQPPEFSKFLAKTLAIGLMNGSSDFEESVATLGQEDYTLVQSRQGAIQAVLNDMEQQGVATILRTHHYFCDNKTCSIMRNNLPQYFDNNHVSSTGAANISDMFSPVVNFVETQKQNASHE